MFFTNVIAERLLRPLGHALAEDAWRVRFTWIIEPMQRLETAGQAWPLKAPSGNTSFFFEYFGLQTISDHLRRERPREAMGRAARKWQLRRCI